MGVRADETPSCPPAHLRYLRYMNDFDLVGVELGGIVEAAGVR